VIYGQCFKLFTTSMKHKHFSAHHVSGGNYLYRPHMQPSVFSWLLSLPLNVQRWYRNTVLSALCTEP